MTRRTVILGSCLALALGASACNDQPTAPATAPTSGAELLASAGPAQVSLDRASLPSLEGIHISDRLTEAARRAINPGDYVCTSTDLIDNLNDDVDAWIADEPDLFLLLYFFYIADLAPQYEALLILNDDTPQEFGYNGEYTNVMNRTHRDAKRFWDIPSDEIQLLAMKGSMLLDAERVSAIYQHPFFTGLDKDFADQIAQEIGDAIRSSKHLNGGNFSLFSFNAFAASNLPDGSRKIIMGDGMLAGYAELGLADVAPQAVYAHEFAHHIQFANGYFADPYATTGSAAERTRYTEMMADAMSAYYLTHKRGAAMNRHRVARFLQAFFEIGDCQFAANGHHGTPNQRMAAAQWGFDLAAAAQKQGHILSSEQVHALFVDAYPDLIAPDAP